jgi:FtsP/CotA-like multicopper oxidase with cupredoxin domain
MYEIELNDTVELIIVSFWDHPMHLHGYSFAVLGMEKVFC